MVNEVCRAATTARNSRSKSDSMPVEARNRVSKQTRQREIIDYKEFTNQDYRNFMLRQIEEVYVC